MKRKLSLAWLVAALLSASLSSNAFAQVAGVMTLNLQLVDGCIVAGSSDPLNSVAFGAMDFGVAPTIFAANLQAQSRRSGSLVQLQCSAGAVLNVLVGDGLNSAAGSRRLAAGAARVNYSLRTQPGGGGSLYAVGGSAPGLAITVPAGGATFDLPIYGLIAPQSGLTAGVYTDTVTVTLSF